MSTGTDRGNRPQLTRSQKLEAIRKLPNEQKDKLLPHEGLQIAFGPLVYQVVYRNLGDMRCTIKLVDVQEEGKIINPHTNKPVTR